MRRAKAAALLLVLLVAVQAHAQAPGEIRVSPGRLAVVVIPTGGKALSYEVLGDIDAFREFDPDPAKFRLRFIGYAEGVAWIVTATAGEKDAAPTITKTKVVIGSPKPQPPGPDPPGPGPGPGPKPTPTGLVKVLILEESAERGKLTAGQNSILFGKTMRDFLDSKCAPDPVLPKAWTIQDKDTDLRGFGDWWESARNRPRTALPWIVIANEKGEFLHEGALPPTVAETQALVSKYVPVQLRKAG